MKLTGPTTTIRKAKRLRREMSLPEVLLWRALRERPRGLKFRRQHPAGPYILDFYADAAKLAVEVDGEAHGRGDRPMRDAERDTWLASCGVITLRLPAAAILSDLDAIVRHIVATADAPSTTPDGVRGGPPPPAGEDW